MMLLFGGAGVNSQVPKYYKAVNSLSIAAAQKGELSVCLTADGSRSGGNGCFVAGNSRLGLRMLFWLQVRI